MRFGSRVFFANCFVCLCLALILAVSFETPAWAQFTTARLNGTVADSSGSAVVGASVKVNQVGTGYTQSTTSGASGEFLFPGLPVGSYRITVTMMGFNTYTQNGIALATNQTVTVPVQLKAGSVTQNVVVTANASMVTTDSATLGQLINQKEIVGLPLNTRYVQQLVFLVPGATNVTANYCAANCEGGVFPASNMPKSMGPGQTG